MNCYTTQQAVQDFTEAVQIFWMMDAVIFVLLPLLAVWFGYRLGISESIDETESL